MDYDDALEWLYGRQALGIKLGLDKVERLLQGIGSPQDGMDIVHVAGTNGKGSVCRLVAGALHRAGHRTGLFTSPHLIHFTERIRIDGHDIPRDAVARGLQTLRPVVEALDADDQPPTFFEINFALAMWWFHDQGVQWAVLETGMGGRLDATNVVDPRLTIITNVGLDHQRYLGGDLASITAEKAGIMKPGVPLVTGATEGPLAVLTTLSHGVGVPMSIVGQDYQLLPDVNGFTLIHPGGEAHYDVAMAGEHQLTNAAIAVAACDALRARGVSVPTTAVQASLAEERVPGRMEELSYDTGSQLVPVLLDGAHNVDAAQALRYHLGRRDEGGFGLVVGFSADKDWHDMLDQWMPLAAHVYVVPLRNSRSADIDQVMEHVRRAGFFATPCADAAEALQHAAQHERIVVAGSLFLVGEARAVLTGESLEEVRGNQ